MTPFNGARDRATERQVAACRRISVLFDGLAVLLVAVALLSAVIAVSLTI